MKILKELTFLKLLRSNNCLGVKNPSYLALLKLTIHYGKQGYTKDCKLVEKVRLYSIINGFWINETGNLEIVIRYTPQDWFELGLMISATTFIGCIGYIFYDWRRERREIDGLKRLRKIKNILKKIYKR